MMPGWMMSGYGMGYGLLGWLLMLLFWILIIGGIVLLVRWFTQQRTGEREHKTEESALDILQKRYARGEINREQFEAMKRDLT